MFRYKKFSWFGTLKQTIRKDGFYKIQIRILHPFGIVLILLLSISFIGGNIIKAIKEMIVDFPKDEVTWW